MTDSTESTQGKHRTSRRRLAPAAIIAGVAASAAIALSMSGTLAAFTAQITNSTNTTATGTLSMQETGLDGTGASVTCNSTDGGSVNTNSATCATISKYGYSKTLVPGQSITTSVTITNTGTVAAKTFTLTPGACTQTANGSVNGSATDLCSKISLGLTEKIGAAGTATTVAAASGTLTADASKVITLSSLAAGASATYAFTITLDSTAGNTYQGLTASQPLVWNFTS